MALEFLRKLRRGVDLQAARAEDEEPALAAEAGRPTLADQLFRVTWTAGSEGSDGSEVVGWVYNDFDRDAVNVRLRNNSSYRITVESFQSGRN